MAANIKLKRSAVAGRIPTTDQLELGEVAINTADGKLYIKRNIDGAESIVLVNDAQEGVWKQFSYTASEGQTTFSGNDDNSQTLSYSVGYAEVYLNGVLLDPAIDFTANTGWSIELTEATALNDLIQIDSFASTIGPGDIVVNEFTGDDSTVSFTLTTDPGTENNVFIYIDGVYQEKATYSVSGTSLVFSEAPYTDASIEAVIGSRNITIDDINDLTITGDFSASGTISGNTFSGTSATLSGALSSGSISTGNINSTGTIDSSGDITTSTDLNANNVVATNNISATGSIEGSSFVLGNGTFSWNSIDGTVDLDYGSVSLQLGQEQHFYAKASEALSNGDVVMFTGAQGDHMLVAKANIAAPGFSPEYVVGVATSNIANNEFGYITSFGKVRGLNTSGYNEGDILYLDPTTPGGLTTTRPSTPTHVIQMAAVLSSNPAEGTIIVRPTHFPDTDEVPEGATNLYYTDQRVTDLVTTNFISNLIDATNVDYDNTVSGISANTVQEAIDYLNTLSGGSSGDVASYTREKFTATAGQTTFTTLNGYTLGYLEVFLNGVLLDVSDYTANDESTVVLTEAAKAGDEIITIALDSFAIAELLRVTNVSASAPDNAIDIDASGKVTINDLSVAGAVPKITIIDTNGTGADSSGWLEFRQSDETSSGYIGYGSTGDSDLYIKNRLSGNVTLHTNNLERLVINSDGITQFSETSSATFPARSINAYSNGYMYVTGGSNGLVLKDDDTSGSRVQIENSQIRFETSGSEKMRLDTNGNLTLSGGISHGADLQETTLLKGIGVNGPVWKVRYDSATVNRYIDFGYVDGFGTYYSGLKLQNNDTMTWPGVALIGTTVSPSGGAGSLSVANKLTVGGQGILNGYGAENYSGIYYSGGSSSGYTAMNTSSANGALYLSRTAAQPEGNLLHFASNGAGVGYIAIKDTNRLAMVSGSCGIKLPGDFNALQPTNGNGGNTDGVMDCGGGPTNRFRNSYISGTAFAGELRLTQDAVYTAALSTDASWGTTGQSIVPPGTLNNNGIYLVTIDWNGSAPVYYSDTAFIVRVTSSNSAGASGGYVRQITANHTGNTATYWEISMQAGAGHIASGIMALHINSPASGTAGINVTRLA